METCSAHTRLPKLLLCKFISPLASRDSLASINDLANFSPNLMLLLQPVQSNSPFESRLLPLVLVGSQAQFSRDPSRQALAKEWATAAVVIACIKATSLVPIKNHTVRDFLYYIWYCQLRH